MNDYYSNKSSYDDSFENWFDSPTTGSSYEESYDDLFQTASCEVDPIDEKESSTTEVSPFRYCAIDDPDFGFDSDPIDEATVVEYRPNAPAPGRRSSSRSSRAVARFAAPMIAVAVIAIAAGVYAYCTRPFVVDVVAGEKNPEVLDNLAVGCLVYKEDGSFGNRELTPVGKVTKIDFNKYGKRRARLNIERAETPAANCAFRLLENKDSNEVGIKIEGGNDPNKPRMESGAAVVLKNPQKTTAELVGGLAEGLGGVGKRVGDSVGSLTSRIPWFPLGIAALAIVGYVFRKAIKIVVVLGVVLGGLYFALRLIPGGFETILNAISAGTGN